MLQLNLVIPVKRDLEMQNRLQHGSPIRTCKKCNITLLMDGSLGVKHSQRGLSDLAIARMR